VLAPANENEKRHASSLVERTRMVLGKAGARLRSLIADSQYSSAKVRGLVEHAVIPYMANQRRGEEVLRVDRLFRTHGPEDLVEVYRRRPAVEASFAFVKTQFGLTVNRVRGLLYVGVYALLSVLCLVLNREAAENMGRPDKALSPTSTCEGLVSGLRGGVVSGCSVCLRGFVHFLGVAMLAVGLVWLVDLWLSRLSDGFAHFIEGLLGVCLF
jgi:hypothetical protein